MQGYDLFMLCVMLFAVVRGYSKGLAWQIASLASIFVSYFVAYRFKELVMPMIEMPDPWRGAIAMTALFVASSLVIWLLFQNVRGAIEKAKLKDFDQQLGAIFGGVKGAIWCTLITLVVLTFLGDSVSPYVVNSRSGDYIARFLANSKRLMPSEIQEVVQPFIEHAENKLQQDRSPAPFDSNDQEFPQDAPAGWEPNVGPTQPPTQNPAFQTPDYWRQSDAQPRHVR